MAENKIIIGKDITINDAREDFFNEIKPLASEVEQEVIEAEEGKTVEEKSITVEDVDINKEHSISVKGSISQEIREGYNLIDIFPTNIYNTYVNIQNDGSFEVEILDNTKESVFFIPVNLVANHDYTMKINRSNATSSITLRTQLYTNDGAYVKEILNVSEDKAVFNVSSDGIYKIRFVSKVTPTSETSKQSITVSNVLLYEGTEEKTYEQYGATPSIEYPSPVKYVSGNYQFKIQNKNLCDGKLRNGTFNNPNSISNRIYSTQNLKIEKGKQYIFNTNLDMNTFKVALDFDDRPFPLPLGSTLKYYSVAWFNDLPKKFTLPIGVDVPFLYLGIAIAFNTDQNITINDIPKDTWFQIEIGDEPTDYIPHEETVKNLDIPTGYELYGETDYYYKKLDKWYVHNEYSKVALKELDWITSNTLNDKTRYITHSLEGKILGALNNDTKVKNAKCTILSIVTASQTYSETEGLSVSDSGFTVIFIDDLSTETDTTKFMELLQDTNAYLIYPLAEPTETEITDETFGQQLDDLYNAEIYEGVTHIDTTTEYEDMVELPNLNLHYNYVTPAPSPNRPSEYKYVEGKQTIVQRNENLINYPYDKDSQERDGIKFEVNNDGTITVNGTATGNATLVLNYTTKELRELLLNNNCFLSGCPSGGSSSSYRLQLYGYTFEGKYALMDSGNGVSLSRFENANNDFNIAIVIHTGTTVNNLVFKPKLEIGDKATDYILPQKQTYELDLPYKLALLGDISDSYEITTSGDDFKIVENIVYHKNFDEAVLKDLDWFLGTTADNYTKFSTRSLNTKIISVLTNNDIFSGKCNILNILSANSTHTKNDGISLNTQKALTCYIDDLSTETDTTKFMQLLTDTNAKLLYPLRNTEDIQIDKSSNSKFYEQVQRLINGSTFDGVNHFMVSAENDVPMNLLLSYTTEYDKEYDFYIDKNNKYFIVPEADIKYIIDPNESDLKNMPEATESTVTIAGRDGDLVLNTRYEPRNYDIIAYTEENLSAEEKQVEINKLKTFINSMKKKTKKFALLANDEFIPVKYNSQMKVQEYPKSVRFEIPLKSSKSYTNNLTKTRIFGAGTDISNTIEPTGCIITIQGPATTPKISLNDYQMQYDNVILSGNKLVIDTNNSTVTHITSSGVRTNAAIYYNHEYPKIQPGVNEIKILSGIANNEQVLTEWYDLKI